MVAVYCIIGVVLSVWSFLSVSNQRKVDGGDLLIAIVLYGFLWPIGLVMLACVVIIDIVNIKHS